MILISGFDGEKAAAADRAPNIRRVTKTLCSKHSPARSRRFSPANQRRNDRRDKQLDCFPARSAHQKKVLFFLAAKFAVDSLAGARFIRNIAVAVIPLGVLPAGVSVDEIDER